LSGKAKLSRVDVLARTHVPEHTFTHPHTLTHAYNCQKVFDFLVSGRFFKLPSDNIHLQWVESGSRKWKLGSKMAQKESDEWRAKCQENGLRQTPWAS